MSNLAKEKGRGLEDALDRYFQLEGYQTAKNVILEGKSGAKHEIDVLAQKSDGITTFKVMVECKAWNQPIEKEIVSKVNYVLRDVGLDKAIIISLGGYRVGADKAAQELGIELWGRDELEQRLGRVKLSELESVKFKRLAWGFTPSLKLEEVSTIVESQRKGVFGEEECRFVNLVHIPCYRVHLLYTIREGLVFKKEVTKELWLLYDGIDGSFLGSYSDLSKAQEVELSCPLQPRVKDSKMKKKIESTFEEYLKKVKPSSVRLWRTRLKALGIPTNAVRISVESISDLFFPFYVGLLQKGVKRRFIAIDGVVGYTSKNMSESLTRNLGYVLEALESTSPQRKD